MPPKKLRAAVVGAGYFARFQYGSWHRIPEVEIVAACNRSTAKLQPFASDFDIPHTYAYAGFERMLAEQKPDFVDIITPPDTHFELCRIAAAHRVPVICQKPLAPTYSETLELAGVGRESRTPFMVHENWRWQPWYREIKTVLESGSLGKPFSLHFSCRLGDGWGGDADLDRQPFFRDYPRLFIFETGFHFLDTFRYLFGEPGSIYARTARRNPVIKGDDAALVVLTFPGNLTVTLDANRYNEPDPAVDNPRYTFGTLRLDAENGHLTLAPDGPLTLQPLGGTPRPISYSPSTGGFAGDCVHALQQHFTASLLAGTPFESTVDDYLKSVRLVELDYESAASNRVIKVTQK